MLYSDKNVTIPSDGWYIQMDMMSLEEYLQLHALTRAEFAAQIPCSEPYISMIARGKAKPGWKMAQRIENVTKGMVPASIWFNNGAKDIIGNEVNE